MKAVVITVFLLLLTSCAQPAARPMPDKRAPVPASSWPMYQYVPSHNAVFDRTGFRVAWVAQLGDRINGGLAVVGDTVYADSFDNYLYAINAVTGDVRWKSRAHNVLMSTPVVSDGRVIVGSGHDGFLAGDEAAQKWGRPAGDDVMAFDARDGRELWSLHTVGEDMASPVITHGRVIFANGDLHAYALRLNNGHVLWRESMPGVDTMASTTVFGSTAFISVCHNAPHFRETRAINIEDGRTLWRNSNGSCDAAPTLDGGIVFVDGNSENGTGPYDPGGTDIVAAIDQRTGRTLWQHVSASGPYTLVGSGEHAVAGTAVAGVLYQSIVNRNALVALDGASGRILWSVSTAAPVKMSPVVTSGVVIFGDTAGLLYSVDRGTGAIRHTGAFKDPFSTSPPLVVGDTLIIANGRYVFAIPLEVV